MIKEKRKEIVIIRRNFLLRESKEIPIITIILIYIVLRTGKIIIMLWGGGYTELLWIIMGIMGISVRIWIIMGITGISVRTWIIMGIMGISVEIIISFLRRARGWLRGGCRARNVWGSGGGAPCEPRNRWTARSCGGR